MRHAASDVGVLFLPPAFAFGCTSLLRDSRLLGANAQKCGSSENKLSKSHLSKASLIGRVLHVLLPMDAVADGAHLLLHSSSMLFHISGEPLGVVHLFPGVISVSLHFCKCIFFFFFVEYRTVLRKITRDSLTYSRVKSSLLWFAVIESIKLKSYA